MLLKETLDLVRPFCTAAMDQLFDTAFKNQAHPQDLLLVLENGTYTEKYVNHPTLKLSPCVVGPNTEGFIKESEYKFYDTYRKNFITKEVIEFQLHNNKDKFITSYEVSVHIEMMIYLKFWESDSNLKEFYELKELALHKPYDWRFSTHDFESKDKKHDDSRNVLIREQIRDQLKNMCPLFYSEIKKIYKSQIRNAIAHSQYTLHSVNSDEPLNYNISFHNFDIDPKKYAPIKSMSLDEWAIYIHSVIMLQNEHIRCSKKYKNIYAQKAIENNFSLHILDCNGRISNIYYYEAFDSWRLSKPQ